MLSFFMRFATEKSISELDLKQIKFSKKNKKTFAKGVDKGGEKWYTDKAVGKRQHDP